MDNNKWLKIDDPRPEHIRRKAQDDAFVARMREHHPHLEVPINFARQPREEER